MLYVCTIIVCVGIFPDIQKVLSIFIGELIHPFIIQLYNSSEEKKRSKCDLLHTHTYSNHLKFLLSSLASSPFLNRINTQVDDTRNQISRIKSFNASRLMTTKFIAGQRQTGPFTTECPDIAITWTLDAQARCLSLSAVLLSHGEGSITFHSLARLIATGTMLAWKHPLLDAFLSTTWASDARHLDAHPSASKKRE